VEELCHHLPEAGSVVITEGISPFLRVFGGQRIGEALESIHTYNAEHSVWKKQRCLDGDRPAQRITE
jgi:hypothetical protein